MPAVYSPLLMDGEYLSTFVITLDFFIPVEDPPINTTFNDANVPALSVLSPSCPQPLSCMNRPGTLGPR